MSSSTDYSSAKSGAAAAIAAYNKSVTVSGSSKSSYSGATGAASGKPGAPSGQSGGVESGKGSLQSGQTGGAPPAHTSLAPNSFHNSVRSKATYGAGPGAPGVGPAPRREFMNNVPNTIETLPTRVRQVRCLPPQYCPSPFGCYPPPPPCYPPSCNPCYPPPCNPCYPPPCNPCYPPPCNPCYPPPCNPYCPPCYPPNPYCTPPCPPPQQPCYVPYPRPYPCMPPQNCCPPPPCPPCPPPPCCPRPRCGPGPPRRGMGCGYGSSGLVCLPRGSQMPFGSSSVCPSDYPSPAGQPHEQPASFNNCNFYCSELPKGFTGGKNTNPGFGEPGMDNSCCAYPLNNPAGDDKVVPPPVGYPGSNRGPWGQGQYEGNPGPPPPPAKIPYDEQIPSGNAYQNPGNAYREPSNRPAMREPPPQMTREPFRPMQKEPPLPQTYREPSRLPSREPSRLGNMEPSTTVRNVGLNQYQPSGKCLDSTRSNPYGKTENSLRAMKLNAALANRSGAVFGRRSDIGEEICVEDLVNGGRGYGGGPLIGGGMLGYMGGKPKTHGHAGYCIDQDYGCHPGQMKPRVAKWKRKHQCCIPKRGRRLKTLCEKCHQRYIANDNHCGLPMPAPPKEIHHKAKGKSTGDDGRNRKAEAKAKSTPPASRKQRNYRDKTEVFGPEPSEHAVVPVGFSHTSLIKPGKAVEVLAPGGSVKVSRPNTGQSTRGTISLTNLPSQGAESRTSVRREVTAEGTKITVRMPHPHSDIDENASFQHLYSNNQKNAASSQMLANPKESLMSVRSVKAVGSTRSAPVVVQQNVTVNSGPKRRRSLEHVKPTEDKCLQPQTIQRPIFSLFQPLCPIRENKASILRKRPVANCSWHDREVFEDVCMMPVLTSSPAGAGAILLQAQQQFALPTRIIQPSRDEISRVIIHKDNDSNQQHIKVIKKHIPHVETVVGTPITPRTPVIPPPLEFSNGGVDKNANRKRRTQRY